MAPRCGILTALALIAGACAEEREPVDPGASSSTGLADTTGSETTTSSGADGSSEGSSTRVDVGADDDTGTGTAGTASESGAPSCDPVVPGEFNSCWDGKTYNGALCNGGGSVGIVTCLGAADVENGSVCIIAGCEDRCDCFARPATGTAPVECRENIVADDTACVLYCGDGQQCPDGMVCGFNICVWEPE